MSVTYKELSECGEALNRFSARELPRGEGMTAMAYRISKNVAAIQREWRTEEYRLYLTNKDNLLKTYGKETKTPDQKPTGFYVVSDENKTAYLQALDELNAEESDIRIRKIDLLAYPCEISAEDVRLLGFMFNIPDEWDEDPEPAKDKAEGQPEKEK